MIAVPAVEPIVVTEASPTRDTAGNGMAAIASLFLPGLGQLAQGRGAAAFVCFVFTAMMWLFTLGFFGWVGHVLAAIDAAMWSPKTAPIISPDDPGI
jgi:TM2 domain-containing membrane protein YozV